MTRLSNAIALLLCLLLLAAGAYLQYGLGIEPCALCMAQRLLFIVLAVILLAALLHNPQGSGRRVYSALVFIVAALGAAAATRQLWLQAQPPQSDDVCVPGFNYMLTHLPLTQTLKSMVVGTGDCGVVTWTFLGFSTPAWTLLFFVVFALFGLWQFFYSRQNKTLQR